MKKTDGMRIERKIVTSIMAIGIIALVSGLGITYYYGMETLHGSTGAYFEGMAREAARVIDKAVLREISDNAAIAATFVLQESVLDANLRYTKKSDQEIYQDLRERDKAWQDNEDVLPPLRKILTGLPARFLENFRKKEGHIGIMVTDVKGALVASTFKNERFYQGGRAWWKAVGGEKHEVYVSNLYATTPDVSYFDIASPIKDETGRMIGAIRSVYNVSLFFSWISEMGFAQTGHTMLVASNGTPIFCPMKPPKKNAINGLLVDTLNTAHVGWQVVDEDGGGEEEKFIVGFAPVSELNDLGVNNLGGNLWYAFVRQDWKEASAPMRVLLFKVASLGVVLIIGLALAGFYIGKSIVQPIYDLQKGATLIGRGHLYHRIQFDGSDEIAGLADEFNRMAEKIQTSTEELKRYKHFPDYKPDPVLQSNYQGKTLIQGKATEALLSSGSHFGAIKEILGGKFDTIANEIEGTGKSIIGIDEIYISGKYYQVTAVDLPSLKAINFYFSDITDRRRLERELARWNQELERKVEERTRELKKARDYLENILESANDVIYTIGPDGRFTYVNQKIKAWGYSKEDLIGAPFAMILTKKTQKAVLPEFLSKKTKEILEIEVKTQKGETRNVLISRAPLLEDEKDLRVLLVIARDITDQKKLESQMLEKEKMATIGHLATNLAHEIRNPLSSIKMTLKILSEQLKLEDVQKRYFSIARGEVSHLEGILNDLLHYAKPGSLELVPVDIHEVMELSLLMADKEIKEKGIHVIRNYSQGLSKVIGDARRLEQVFLNIYLNAIQAMEDEGRLEISTHQDLSSKRAHIEISDNGCGICRDTQKNLYKPFFTTKRYGTGLGLAIVNNIVREHHGKIKIQNGKKEGATCHIALDIAE